MKPVKVVVKAFELMEVLSRHRELTLKDLATHTRFPKPTTFRILNTLMGLGYVEHQSLTQTYSLSPKFLSFTKGSTNGRDLITLAEPFMEKLSATYSETVNLARLIDNQVIYVRVLQSSQAFRISDNVGDRAPIHSTAIGKAIAAFLPEQQLKAVLKKSELTPFTRNTITNIGELTRHFKRVRTDGYAIDNEEGHDGVLCIGAPVFQHDNAPFGALSISMPKVRAKRNVLQRMLKDLTTIAAQISLELGTTRVPKRLVR